MKREICSILAAALLLAFAGCSDTGAGEVNTPGPLPDISETSVTEGKITTADTGEDSVETDLVEMSEEEIRQAMIERSLMTTGDTGRMAKVLKKAAAGEEITVAFIGGSITEGLTVGSETCWARQTYEWLCEQYPDTTINYVNAGMSGTPSTIGLIRAERDLYTFDTLNTGGRPDAVIAETLPANIQPDIVFIEFAVNDGQSQVDKECYESLVKKVLSRENQPAVVLLFTVLKNGYTCEKHMSQIGEHYNLPMISVNNVLQPEFESGRMTWETYSDDESHPNEYGHKLVAELLQYYFKQVMPLAESADGSAAALPESPVFSDKYQDMELLDSESLTPDSLGSFVENQGFLRQFPNGWTNTANGTEPIVFTIECKTLFMVLHTQNSGRYGAVDVKVDGEYLTTVNSNRSNGWGAPDHQLLFSNEESAPHTIEISLAPGSEKTYFGLAGFGVVK